MARKDLLKGLMDAPADKNVDAPSVSRLDPSQPRYKKGAIGAVSQSIAALKSRSVSEIDPHLIDGAGVQDRLDHNEAEHAALMASIKDYGQQVPILVRPHPTNDDRYQIVYGRRRVLAMRDLGLPVKAMIRDLGDAELVMAQGQENSARRDLSFIEKVNFARQMRDADYDRKAMCAALHIDKTVISRMLSIIDRIPVGLIEAIGAAPNVGRDRWLGLADAYEISGYNENSAIGVLNLLEGSESSDKRFEAIVKALVGQGTKTPIAAQPSTRTPLRSSDGLKIGQASWGGGKMTLTLNKQDADGFDEWLVANLSEIHQSWKSGRGE